MEVDLRPSSGRLDPGIARPTHISRNEYPGAEFVVDGESVLLGRPAAQSAPEPLRLLNHWRASIDDAN